MENQTEESMKWKLGVLQDVGDIGFRYIIPTSENQIENEINNCAL